MTQSLEPAPTATAGEDLTAAQRQVVADVQAARQRGADRESRGEQPLAAASQEFPAGIRPDGTLHVEG